MANKLGGKAGAPNEKLAKIKLDTKKIDCNVCIQKTNERKTYLKQPSSHYPDLLLGKIAVLSKVISFFFKQKYDSNVEPVAMPSNREKFFLIAFYKDRLQLDEELTNLTKECLSFLAEKVSGLLR